MHLHRLKIDNFRNLRDFEITFAANADVNGELRRLRSHSVIGQNGSGKSNMIEAIVTIFRDLDLNESTAFDYELDYEVRGFQIQIKSVAGRVPEVTIDGEEVAAWILSDLHVETVGESKPERGSARQYLPSHVFTYYSGKSERLEALFREHQERFIDNLTEYEEEIDSDSPLRRLFYCRHPHSKLVLLACLLAPETPLKEILHDLRIEDVDSVLFTLKRPFRLSGDLSAEEIKAGDNRFWYDSTRFTEEFLAKVWDLAIAPIDHTEDKTIDFRGRTEPQDLLYLFLKDKDALTQLKDHIGDSYRFFRYVEGSYIADLLDDIQIFVKHKNSEDLISFEQLSEGELQLLTVLGLMRITHQDECLFLLDEPDTHLNPIWKLRYFDEIEKVLKQDDDEIIKGDSQIIITTHDPMMIGSLRKEQVRIISQQNGKGIVECPDEHPQGMGVAGLLKSQYFGLRSTVDSETRRRLDRRNFLFSMGKKRSVAENEELSRLSDELADLGFASDFRDPYLELFVKRMAVHTRFHKDILTPTEQKDQDAIADKIIDEILAEDAAE
ncbi:MAG TPA: AAA family ATPase [Planctomycetaceae bacterium]|nr:AAA family ATPase [Planctomycetaceae bacterium]